MSGRIVIVGDNCDGMSQDPSHSNDATARALGTNTSGGRVQAYEDVDKNWSYLPNMSKLVNSSRWIRTVLALGGSTLYLMEMVAQDDVWDISNHEGPEFKFTANEVKWNKSGVETFSKNDKLSGSCLETNKYAGIFAEASCALDSLVLDESDFLAPPAPASASIRRYPGFQHLYMYEPYKMRYDPSYTHPNKEYDEYEVGYIVNRVTTTYSELSKKLNKSQAEIYQKLNTSFTETYKKQDDSEGQIDTPNDSVGQIDTLNDSEGQIDTPNDSVGQIDTLNDSEGQIDTPNDSEGQIDSLVDDLIGEALQQSSSGDKSLVAEEYEKLLHPVELIDSLLDDLIGGVVELSRSGAKNHVAAHEDFVDFILTDDSFDSSFEMNEF